MDDISQYAEQGTAISGYEERGPYHCSDCRHRLDPKSDLCIHPVVIADPELKDRLVQISDGDTYQQAIRINLEKGCCGYVNQSKDEKPIVLVLRHGQTILNKDKKFRSWKNVPLDEIGIQQAEDAAQFLKDYPIKKIFTSPLDRAVHTAMFVEEVTEAPIFKHPNLLPWNLGEITGKSRDENADILNYYIDHPEETIPGGESLKDFRDRMFSVFEEVVSEASKDNLILIVAHTSTITTLNQWVDENYTGRPETDDESVQPGGVVALYADEDKDDFELDPIWGQVKKSDYGS
jgi:broad specificity phosphatase PhoE